MKKQFKPSNISESDKILTSPSIPRSNNLQPGIIITSQQALSDIGRYDRNRILTEEEALRMIKRQHDKLQEIARDAFKSRNDLAFYRNQNLISNRMLQDLSDQNPNPYPASEILLRNALSKIPFSYWTQQ